MSDVDADALLAQALWEAEKADLYEQEYGADRSDDSDYSGRPGTKRRKKQQQRKGRANKQAKNAAANSNNPGSSSFNSPAALQQQQQQQQQRQQPQLQPKTEVFNANVHDHDILEVTAAGLGHQGSDTPAAPLQQGHQVFTSQAAALPPDSADPAQQQQQQGGSSDEQQLAASGRRKRKDCGQKRERGRAWSDAEEASFLAGLEQHGRDWKAIGAAIGSRDSRAVASHAQKHFIRLCLAGQPLPAKVAETGVGYTLSGKLLDPASAAAQAYGFKPELISRLEGEQLATALAGMLPLGGTAADAAQQQGRDQVSGAAAPAVPKRSKASNTSAGTSSNGSSKGTSSNAGAAAVAADELAAVMNVPRPALAPTERAALAAAASAFEKLSAAQAAASLPASSTAAAAPGIDSPQRPQQQEASAVATAGPHTDTAAAAHGEAAGPAAEPSLPTAAAANSSGAVTEPAAAPNAAATGGDADADGLTAYARSRPRREGAGQRLLQLGATSESLELVGCRDFVGPIGSGAPAAQPYAVEVELQVMLTMEVHAHLSSCEVIGLLGGSWDAAGRRMTVTAAYPCSRAQGSDATTSVELSPESEVEARGEMAAAGQRCVGWYHSHPVFEASPSMKDMENQRNYQALTRDGDHGNTNSTGAAAATGSSSSSSAAAGGASKGLEPFIGYILSPYDPSLPRPHTAITAFVVQQKGQLLVPYRIKYGLVGSTVLPGPAHRAQLRSLLASCKCDLARTPFNAPWRCFTALSPVSGGLLGPGLTKLEKLLYGLRWQCGWVEEQGAVEAWLRQISEDIQEVWELPLHALQEQQVPIKEQQQSGQLKGQHDNRQQGPCEELPTAGALGQDGQQPYGTGPAMAAAADSAAP